MYYGGTASHAHGDPLNLGYIAYDLDLMPDLGYPDTSSDDLAFFPRTTRSHNTVMVNGLPVDAFGEPTNFDDSGFVKLASVDANGVAGLSNAPDGLYKRTTALIRINEEDSYIVDLFDLNGGLNYEYSFHSGESESANTVYQGLELSTSGADELSLKNFRKDANGTSGAFSVDWNLKDTYNRYGHGAGAVTDVHLKMTMLGDYDEVTIADGIPPQNSLTNPKRLEYIFVKSNDSRTVYTSVIEPYRGASSIASIERLPVVENNGAAADPAVVKALRVAFKDGRTDFIVQSLDASMVYTVAGKFAFSGFFGVYSEQDGKLVRAYLHEGTRLGGLVNGTPAVKGFVAGRTDTLAVENFIDLSVALPIEPALLIGKYIYIDNDADVNAVYRIEGASRHDDHIRLHIGDVSVVNAWRDSADFSQGYAFSFEPGDAFRIPLSLSKRYAEGIGDDGYPKPASAAPE
nr:heparinase II/III family protein [Cohnella hashimotonis]